MKSLSLSQISRAISQFLHRFHVTLFVVFVVGGLSLVTYFLNLAITNENADTTTASQQPFDQATMLKIKNLRTTTDQSSLTPPDGRTNPFN